MHGAVQRIQSQAAASIEQVTQTAAESAITAVTERVDSAHEKAEKVMALAAKIEARQLWTAAGALCLTLLPAATVALGGIIVVSGVVFGWQIAMTPQAATWLRVVKGIGAGLGTACALAGLAFAVRWVAGYVGQWKTTSPGRRRG
ncbi:hypothetical protein [Leekyejoonella antrihumi]|uniref:Uncharacterized protein n=1 Tax=Leekyejoonella antrihumi TaxID=1660198 RepID=A0A563DV24_9MICO|nr:hypothetical protein [Leekyejoonella antrihumi]TWP33544.1 hypothetical protein FGL98_21085 [Leekyejoonella antrihumi]